MQYDDYLEKKHREHGEQFDPSDLDPRFVEYYNTGQRIKVRTCGIEITGTVGVTTGWKPAFLLIRTSRSLGSSWLMTLKDSILAVKRGRNYIPIN